MRGNFSLAKSMRAHPKAMIFEISFFLCRPAQDPSQKKAKNVSALKFFNFRITVFCHSSMKTASFVRESPSPKAKIFGNSKQKRKNIVLRDRDFSHESLPLGRGILLRNNHDPNFWKNWILKISFFLWRVLPSHTFTFPKWSLCFLQRKPPKCFRKEKKLFFGNIFCEIFCEISLSPFGPQGLLSLLAWASWAGLVVQKDLGKFQGPKVAAFVSKNTRPRQGAFAKSRLSDFRPEIL